MKPLFILLTFCFLSVANLGFAQQSFEASKFQIGFSNYSYFANQYTNNLEDKLIQEKPFATRWGLSAARTIGDHFGFGASLQYRRWQDETVIPMDPRLMIIFIPVEERYQEFTHHIGLVDLYGRWYAQEAKARLRTYVQIGVGTEATIGGNYTFPMSNSEEARAARKVAFSYNGLLFSLGIGLQYRLTQNWGLESGFMAYWPGGLAERPFVFNQYGLQIGLFRTF